MDPLALSQTRRRFGGLLVLLSPWLTGLPRAMPLLRAALVDIEPYGFRGEDAPGGIYVECMREIAELAGLQVQIEVLPLGRAIQAVNQGLSDLCLLLPNAGFAPEVRSLGAIGPIEVQLLPRRGLAITSLSQLAGLRVAQLRGAARWQMLPSSVQRFEVANGRAMVGMAHRGHLDAALAAREVLHYGLQLLHLTEADFAPALRLGPLDAHLWARPGLGDEPAQRLQQACAELRRRDGLARATARQQPTLGWLPASDPAESGHFHVALQT